MSGNRKDQAWQSRRAHDRKVLIARVEARWEDQAGVPCISWGVIEDISSGGIAIRLRQAVPAGRKIGIKWPREQFSGIVKYCCRAADRSGAGLDYVIGIQRLPVLTTAVTCS
jgi:hypothetical protein